MHEAGITGGIALRLRAMLATISGSHMGGASRLRRSQTRTETDGASGQNHNKTDKGKYPDHELQG